MIENPLELGGGFNGLTGRELRRSANARWSTGRRSVRGRRYPSEFIVSAHASVHGDESPALTGATTYGRYGSPRRSPFAQRPQCFVRVVT